jgi:hypothetical protein
MDRRLTCALCVMTAAVSLAPRAQSPAGARRPAAAKPWAGPRTAWGDPDLEGVWNYGTMTPLERPAQWAGKETLSEAEAVAYERDTMGRRATANNTAGPDWWEPENNVLKDRRTALIVDPPDGRIPPTTVEAQARAKAQGRGRGRGGAYDGPENLSLQDRCLSWGAAGPPMMPTVYNNNVQIVQTRAHVVLVNEMIHVARIIPMDGKPHGEARSWYGDARGRWEGDTLVVDTVNFNGRVNFRNTGQNLHLIERFTRTSADRIEYRFTVDDPSLWTKPWTVMLSLTPTKGPMYEFACHEGNSISVIGTLKGARLTEKP